jgi:hypothetical protein
MKLSTNLILILLLLNSCKSPKHHFPLTTRIDTAAYKLLKAKLKCRYITEAPEYLGGLNPNYPIAIIGVDLTEPNSNDWLAGGLIVGVEKVLIKKQNNYVVINNKKDLQKTFAPINTPQAALSYAILNTRYFATFDEDFFKSRYKYYGINPEVSFIKKDGQNYMVHLFHYQQFGCDHPYFSALFKVTPGGEVTLIESKKSFEDPKDNGLCVD